MLPSSLPALLLALLPACAPDRPAQGDGGSADGGGSDTGDTGPVDPGPATFRFAYAIVADPHVTDAGDRQERLQAAVDWIAAQAPARDIQLVFVLGDIAWGEGFDEALATLSTLPLPWLPVLGDNEIQAGDELGFEATFGPVLDATGATLPGWRRAPRPVDNPVEGGESWLQNWAFDHGGLRFVGLDWNARILATGWGEMPDLHDFEGGTLPFLREEVAALQAGTGKDERMVLLSHMPMIVGPGSFDLEEAAALEALLGPVGDQVAANHAGHLHGDAEDEWEACGLHVDTTDATWDDVVSVRVVRVSEDAVRFHLEGEVLVVE